MRAFAERIGISVDWDVATRTVIITTDHDFRAELESPDEAVLYISKRKMA
ncbi:stalk domain-containing protein [Paenibacillus sp. FSL F4-0125]